MRHLTEQQFITRLSKRLREPLPGSAARRSYAPQLCYGRHDAPPRWDARQAAVMLLLFPDGGDWRIPLTKRPDTLSVHSGQVSLPGGGVEEGETTEIAAQRELQEELGVAPESIVMRGQLSSIYVYASNFHVIPYVATTARRPRFIPNPAEVANLIEPSLVELVDPNREGIRNFRRRGVRFAAPEIQLHGESIWGATRLILAELSVVVRDIYRSQELS